MRLCSRTLRDLLPAIWLSLARVLPYRPARTFSCFVSAAAGKNESRTSRDQARVVSGGRGPIRLSIGSSEKAGRDLEVVRDPILVVPGRVPDRAVVPVAGRVLALAAVQAAVQVPKHGHSTITIGKPTAKRMAKPQSSTRWMDQVGNVGQAAVREVLAGPAVALHRLPLHHRLAAQSSPHGSTAFIRSTGKIRGCCVFAMDNPAVGLLWMPTMRLFDSNLPAG